MWQAKPESSYVRYCRKYFLLCSWFVLSPKKEPLSISKGLPTYKCFVTILMLDILGGVLSSRELMYAIHF